MLSAQVTDLVYLKFSAKYHYIDCDFIYNMQLGLGALRFEADS